MVRISPFDDLIDFLARLAPEAVLSFQLSEASIRRIRQLLDLEKAGRLSFEEKEELDRFCIQEDLVNLAKARAQVQLAQR